MRCRVRVRARAQTCVNSRTHTVNPKVCAVSLGRCLLITQSASTLTEIYQHVSLACEKNLTAGKSKRMNIIKRKVVIRHKGTVGNSLKWRFGMWSSGRFISWSFSEPTDGRYKYHPKANRASGFLEVLRQPSVTTVGKHTMLGGCWFCCAGAFDFASLPNITCQR